MTGSSRPTGEPQPTSTADAEVTAPSSEALRLRQLLRYNDPAAPVTIPLILVLYWKYPSAVLLILVVGLLGTVALQRVALSYARRGRTADGAIAMAFGIWCQTLNTGIFAPQAWPLTTVFSILAVVIALPFVHGRQLVGLIGGATAILTVGGIFATLPPIISLDPVPDTLLRVLVTVGSLIGAVLCMLSIWQSGQRMQETIDATRASNDALRESERTLEAKVEVRTAELELSRRELEVSRDEAVEANRAKSNFLANMSHELRTPLNAIIGYGEMLQEDAETITAEHLLDIDRIVRSGHYLLSLVNGVLDMSRIEAGKMGAHLEDFDLDALLRDVGEIARPLAGANANRLETVVPQRLGTMHSDATKVRQVLLNLLGNASKFTRNGVIIIGASGEADPTGVEWIEMTVTDTGIGMTAEQLDRVFDAFVQAEDTTVRDFGGTGLGLTISRQFCEILGGTVSAHSVVGRGSTFTVRLPRRASIFLQEATDGPALPSSGSVRGRE